MPPQEAQAVMTVSAPEKAWLLICMSSAASAPLPELVAGMPQQA